MRKALYQIVKRVGRGRGRDFIVADIHGSFHLVKRALDAVSFNPKVDRLFVVGDLVDRGPYSQAVLEFLREPWVFVVRGNHEQMVLDLYATGTLDEDALAFHVERNGMGWWLETPQARREAILDLFAQLPVAMEIETARGSVGMVHAEVPVGMDWPTFVSKLEAFDHHTIQSALWGRIRASRNDTRGVRGIDRVFSGHTPQFGGARKLGNCYLVDTGACFNAQGHPSGKLTMANLACQTGIITTGQPRVLPLIDLFEPTSAGPFGNYTS